MLVYIDDIVLAGSSATAIKRLMQKLAHVFYQGSRAPRLLLRY
jgi:hypothetical protein